MSFVGHSKVSIDQKRRIAIPAKYREELVQVCANKLVCTIGKSGAFFLRLYPRPAWDQLESETDPKLLDRDKKDTIMRLLQAMAEDVTVDSNHRLLLPQHLVEKVGLNKKVVIVGRGSYFEVWSEKDWDAEFSAGFDRFSQWMEGADDF